MIAGKVGYKPDPVVPVDQQKVCAALVTSARHGGEEVSRGAHPLLFFFKRKL